MSIIVICLAVVLIISVLLITYKHINGADKKSENQNGTDEDIVIMFTSDLHSAIDDNMTMSQVAAYRLGALARTPYVTLVDCGDQYQGSYIGSVSKGQAEVELMNLAGYDFAIFGNHEFDFGMQRLHELVDMSNTQYLNCNITYSGSGTSAVEKSVPYKIVKYGNRKIAYIGVSAPTTLYESTPVYFKENDEYVYDFCQGDDGKKLYAVVQKYVDEVTELGADYVVLISHLGASNSTNTDVYSSEELIKHTHGISAVLDGHTHLTFNRIEVNEYEEPVIIAQAGTKLNVLGQLVISKNGFVSASIYDTILGEVGVISELVKTINEKYNNALTKHITSASKSLPIIDGSGLRISRNQETALGNLVSDSMRIRTGADIGYINGGGLRDGINAGEVTFKDIINVLPFGNMICTIEVTGQEVLDILEYFSRNIDTETIDIENSRPKWEDSNFPDISGIKFTVDTSVTSSVETDVNDMLISIVEGKPRRVSDVLVLQNNEYVPIDTKKTYTIASHNYFCKNGGNGMEVFLKGHKLQQDCVKEDYLNLHDYINENLKGDLSGYYEVDKRITIK